MKKIALILALCAFVHFAAFNKAAENNIAKTDTIKDIRNQPKPHEVKGKRSRIRMQLRQGQKHEQQDKKVQQAQKEVKKAQQQQQSGH